MQALLSAMDNKLLNHICSEFARDNRLGRAGLPDLTLWKTSDNTCKVFQYSPEILSNLASRITKISHIAM